uniref:FYVE zinc finger domain-containing protein n=1 Tax=Trichobilharzia regenti TaxID=157069 RepID=A0AA85K4D2_TRIRE|nr:unnamed protein product [Trichobilharzia regenti]
MDKHLDSTSTSHLKYELLNSLDGILRMSCDLCLIEFTALKRKKTCKICGSIQCSSCLRYKTKSHKPICIDCYYDSINGNNPNGKTDKLASPRCKTEDKNCSENCKVPSNRGVKTDDIIKRLEALKVPRTEVKENVANLESRLQQLKGLTNKKPSCSINTSRKEEDEVTRIIKQGFG